MVMGRTFAVIRSRDVARLFAFFGLEVDAARVEAHRAAIQSRFAVEVEHIVRLCSNLPERERFKLFREALRLSYESAILRAGHAA
jgi:hypothetical protein